LYIFREGCEGEMVGGFVVLLAVVSQARAATTSGPLHYDTLTTGKLFIVNIYKIYKKIINP
jgi:hypothetical protein